MDNEILYWELKPISENFQITKYTATSTTNDNTQGYIFKVS